MLSRKGRRCQTPKRYDVAFRIKNKDHLSRIPASINGISSQLQKDEVLKTLLVCGELKANTLYLRTREPGSLSEIKQHVSRIRDLFKVDFELVEPNYLFHAYELKRNANYKDDREGLSKANAVNVVGFYQRFSKWWLELDSLSDAQKLSDRRSLVMPGENMPPTAIRAVRTDSIPIHCYKCSAAGHYQDKCKSERQICGKCGGEHKSKDCALKDTKDFRCPNCSDEEGRGHANWFQCCQNPRSKAEWKRASVAAKTEPEWLTTHKQSELLKHFAARDAPAASAKRRGASSPARRGRKKGRVTQTAVSEDSKSTSAKFKSMNLDKYFSTGQPESSQPLMAASSSQERDSDTSASTLSSQVRSTTNPNEMFGVLLSAEETMTF